MWMLASKFLWDRLAPALPWVILAVAILGAYWWQARYHYNRGYEKGEAIHTQALQDAAVAYAAAAARQQETIDTLTADLAKARTRSAGLSGRLQGTLANEPESREWAAVPVPDAVRLLVTEAGGDAVPAHPFRNP